MPVTMTANFKTIFKAETVEKIEELVDDLYELSDMVEFVDEHSEDEFLAFYEEYVRCGENIGYEAVDALIEEYSLADIEDCDERYQGHYQSTADFAEEYVTEMGYDIPSIVEIDWEATWECNLYRDFTAVSDGQTYCPIHIFRDN
jgi:antirestriction protein